MATPSEADSEAHLGAPLHASKSLVEKKLPSTQPSEAGSEKQEASKSHHINSSQLVEPPSLAGKQDGATKVLQENHATTLPCVPVPQASNASLSGDDVAAKKHAHPYSQTSEPHGLDKLQQMNGPGMPMVGAKASQASSTVQLLSAQTGPSVLSNGHQPSFANAVIDTAAPFESVKEAVTLFGERAVRIIQSQCREEKKVTPGFDIQKAIEEMVLYEKRLIAEETSIISTLGELEKMKEKIYSCKSGVPATAATGEGLSPSNQPELGSNVGVAKDLHVSVLCELESIQKEIEDVSKDKSEMEASKQAAGKESEAAINAQERALTRVQELLTEDACMRNSLEAAKGTLAEIEADISFLRSISSVKLNSIGRAENGKSSDPRLVSLDLNSSECDVSIEKLLKELGATRGNHMSISEGELLAAKIRLEQAKIVEGNQMTALGSVLEQLDETKLNLKKAMDEAASLPPTIGALQTEISQRRSELESAHETEQIACATLASLQDELCNVRSQVLSAQAGESKAREAKRTLPAAIKQLAADADEAKAASNLAREEARKGRLELEVAKAGTIATLSRFQAAQKEAEAARTSEAMALAEFKALSKSEGDSEGKIMVSITFGEYHTLHDAGQEAEEAADKKVAVILMQVEAAMASQHKAQEKLDIVLENFNMLGKALEEAQKKADDAQVAKLSVEAELRKWRAEHEQWRKTAGSSNPSSVNTSAAQSPRFVNGKGSHGKALSHSFQGKGVGGGLDSLAEVLTLKVPTVEKAAKVMVEMELPKKSSSFKKVSFFARVLSILLRKKKKKIGA